MQTSDTAVSQTNYVFLMTMADGDGVSYGLNVEDGYNLAGQPIITWPWAGGADNELWAIEGDGSVASAMLDKNGNPLYLGVDPSTNAIVLSSTKYYWTIGAPGTVGAITAADGTVITIDPGQSLQGAFPTLAPAALTDDEPGPQSWWAAPNIQRVVPQFTAWRYIASTLTDSDNDTFVLTIENGTGLNDDQQVQLQPIAASSPNQLWQITPDGRLLSGTNEGLTLGLAPEPVSGGTPIETQWSIDQVSEQFWTFPSPGLIANASGPYLNINGEPNSLSPSDPQLAVVTDLPEGTPPQSFTWQLVPGNPLATIVAQAPTPFLLFEGVQAEIYAYLMNALGIADLRAEYPNLTAPLASYQSTIDHTNIPPQFEADRQAWHDVVNQLNTELRDAQTVIAYFAQFNAYQTDLQTYFDGQIGSLGAMANLTQGSSTSVGGLVLSIFEGIAYAALEAVPGGAEAVSLASIVGNVMEMAVNVGTNAANVKTSISPSPYEVAFSEFQQTIDQNFAANLQASGLMETVILSDPGKMAAFYVDAQSNGANCLGWPAGQTGTLVNQATPSLQVSILQALLPATFQIFFYTDDDSDPVDDVPAACQWVTPAGNGLWGKYWIGSQQDWETYPDAGMMQQYIWDNGVKPSDFFQSQNGWAFPIANWGGTGSGGAFSLVVSNQTPYVLWVQLNTKNTGETTQLFGYPKVGPAGSTASMSTVTPQGASLGVTISILGGPNVASFTVDMPGWGLFHSAPATVQNQSTATGYSLSTPNCPTGDVGDNYTSTAQITLSWANS